MSLSVNGSTGGYGWLFGSASKDSSKTNYASLTSAMFGNSGSILGEYAMIKSGAYQKIYSQTAGWLSTSRQRRHQAGRPA